MKKIPTKNYIILAILIIFTMLLTLFLSNIYISSNKEKTDIYNYLNKINSKEFEQYITENPESLIYIADKYDLSNLKFERQLEKKVVKYNMKEKIVFLDVEQLDDKFLKSLDKKYNLKINLNKLPAILYFSLDDTSKLTYINNDTSINSIIEYEAFK